MIDSTYLKSLESRVEELELLLVDFNSVCESRQREKEYIDLYIKLKTDLSTHEKECKRINRKISQISYDSKRVQYKNQLDWHEKHRRIISDIVKGIEKASEWLTKNT